jgi:hypothetical protein
MMQVTSQGMLRIAGTHQKLGRKKILSKDLREEQDPDNT